MSYQQALRFPVSVQRLPQKGLNVKIDADERERKIMTGNHDLVDVRSFKAEFLVTQWKKNGIRLRGTIRADIVQSCIVTLEPVEARVDEKVDTVFVPENSRLARSPLDESGEMILSADGPDAPETFSGDSIDIGAVAEEFFGLAINPYPRKADAVVPEAEPDEVDEIEKPVNPFAKLAEWKQKP